MVLNAAPSIQRIHRDADILFAIFVNAQTRSTVSRLIHKSGLGTKHFPVRILILYPAQKQDRAKMLELLTAKSNVQRILGLQDVERQQEKQRQQER